MTAVGAHGRATTLDRTAAARITSLLESDFGRANPGRGAILHHYLLDALDRGEYDRFLVWPARDPVSLVYAGTAGTVVPAGDPLGGGPLASATEHLGWRVLVGGAEIGESLLEATRGGIFRRRVSARDQRYMAIEASDAPPEQGDPAGFRRALPADVEQLVDLACRLHVEDRMGPPISRSARGSVRARMGDSIRRGTTWVVERDGRVVAKADLALVSARRGAQIAGVFVESEMRGRGLASGLISAIVRTLFAQGLPGVSLHVRADNAAAITAYRRAGLTDRARWLLALR